MTTIYNKVIMDSKKYKLRIPSYEQYIKNKYYYNNRIKKINNRIRNKIIKQYGICEFVNGEYSVPSWLND